MRLCTSVRQALFAVLALAVFAPALAIAQTIEYPQTHKIDHTDDYHGTVVADPYRWLEDVDSDETAAWVEAQNVVTFGYLEGISEREWIRERLTELWNYERYSIPWKDGGRYFYSKNDGLQNQSVYYMQETLDSEPVVALDPNKLSEDGTVSAGPLDMSRKTAST
jgi:prolyl oligopeptidase